MVWLGALRDVDTGQDTWRWVTGNTVSYIFWGDGQPNNYNKVFHSKITSFKHILGLSKSISLHYSYLTHISPGTKLCCAG